MLATVCHWTQHDLNKFRKKRNWTHYQVNFEVSWTSSTTSFYRFSYFDVDWPKPSANVINRTIRNLNFMFLALLWRSRRLGPKGNFLIRACFNHHGDPRWVRNSSNWCTMTSQMHKNSSLNLNLIPSDFTTEDTATLRPHRSENCPFI